jgi:hypothetical protein
MFTYDTSPLVLTYIPVSEQTFEHWQYKKGLVYRINPSLLQKINLFNTRRLQLTKFDQMKLYTKDN